MELQPLKPAPGRGRSRLVGSPSPSQAATAICSRRPSTARICRVCRSWICRLRLVVICAHPTPPLRRLGHKKARGRACLARGVARRALTVADLVRAALRRHSPPLAKMEAAAASAAAHNFTATVLFCAPQVALNAPSRDLADAKKSVAIGEVFAEKRAMEVAAPSKGGASAEERNVCVCVCCC